MTNSIPDALIDMPLPELTGEARRVRDEAHGNRVTFSPKVFIPLTMLCRDRCGYCTFAKRPARLASPYLSPDEVLAIARQGGEAGCHEALFTLGERPEHRYPVGPAVARRARLRVDRRLPGRHVRARCSTRPACSPTPTPAPCTAEELAALRAGHRQPGDDARDARPDLAGPPAAPPTRRPSAAWPPCEAAGRARDPVHHRHPRRHRRDPGRPARRAGGHRRRPPPVTATCRR